MLESTQAPSLGLQKHGDAREIQQQLTFQSYIIIIYMYINCDF